MYRLVWVHSPTRLCSRIEVGAGVSAIFPHVPPFTEAHVNLKPRDSNLGIFWTGVSWALFSVQLGRSPVRVELDAQPHRSLRMVLYQYRLVLCVLLSIEEVAASAFNGQLDLEAVSAIHTPKAYRSLACRVS